MIELLDGVRTPLQVEYGNVGALKDRERTTEKNTLTGDVVTISEEGKRLSDERMANSPEGSTSVDAGKNASENDDSGSDAIATIRKRIQNLKKQLQRAQQELMEARSEAASKKRDGNGLSAEEKHNAGKALAPDGATEEKAASQSTSAPIEGASVAAAQAKVDMLNVELLQAQSELAEAMKGAA